MWGGGIGARKGKVDGMRRRRGKKKGLLQFMLQLKSKPATVTKSSEKFWCAGLGGSLQLSRKSSVHGEKHSPAHH